MYKLCLDLKTNRIIYFTADEQYLTPDNGFVYAAQVDELPSEISLDNCWQYRFQSGHVVHASIANRKPQGAQTLAQTNEKALRKALRMRLESLWERQSVWDLNLQTDRLQDRAKAFKIAEEAVLSQFQDLSNAEHVATLAQTISTLELE